MSKQIENNKRGCTEKQEQAAYFLKYMADGAARGYKAPTFSDLVCTKRKDGSVVAATK